MRLLKIDDNDGFSLIGPVTRDIPEYAILSHTWGADDEEVTYEDLINGTGKDKPGYSKIKFCVEQAYRDGLRYSWVDTCCINKADFTELSKSINSMFKWYSKATRCYVYLSDVPDPKDQTSTIEASLSKSRWFTRGWTLQELIVPSLVQFFSWKGEPLGDKKTREQLIHQITGVAIEALQGTPLAQFSLDDRLSWAARRETTVEEDAAYCLLGIFDTHMPLIYGEGRQKALARLQREIHTPSNPASFVAAEAAWIVPFERNPRFTGRKTQLARLEGKLFAKDHTPKIAITGLGGIGKTQLVLELLFQTKEKYKDCLIMWIPATSPESLHQGYLDVAQQLQIPGWEEKKADVKKVVQEYLNMDDVGRWLLVFDNSDDMDMWITTTSSGHEDEQESSQESLGGSRRLIDYLPKNKQGCIIFTTRDRKTAVKLAQQNIVEVLAMDGDAAMELLKKCLVSPDLAENKKDTTALLAELTYLPLAIVQAAAYINENGITLADYLSLLEEKEEEIISLLSEEFEDDGRYHNVKNPVATTWLISFEQIRRRDPLAAEYLSFVACVDPKDIPQSLLPPGPSRKKEIDAIGTLTAYSFVSRRPMDLALDVHRLVHLATRNWLRNEGLLAQWTERTIAQLEEVFPDNDHRNRSMWRMYLPHVRYVLESDLVNKDGESRVALMWRYGDCLYSDGRWNEAETSFTEVLEINTRILGEDHTSTLRSMANLASTYRNQGRWEEAEKIEALVLETRKKKLGEDHLGTITSMANLAITYSKQGRDDKAEKLKVEVVKTRKKKLGEDHPSTLTSMANLAVTLWNLGRWKESEELGVQVLETRKKKLGEDHPDTLTSIANLASTYKKQGRWEEAEQLLVRAIETGKKKLGEDHPSTLNSIVNLASTLLNQGRWKEAEQLLVRAMETCKKKLGEDHPSTLNSIVNLASTLLNQGRWKEAEQLLVRAIETCKKKLGEDHPSTLTGMANLAMTYGKQGREDKAEKLLVQVMETRKKKLGEDHPSTLASMNNLAFTLKAQGRDAEAVRLMDDCVQRRKRILGFTHPAFLSSNAALTKWEAKHVSISG